MRCQCLTSPALVHGLRRGAVLLVAADNGRVISRRGTVTGPPAREHGRRDGFAQLDVEPMTGIEPAYSAWEADVLPLNYIGDEAYGGYHPRHLVYRHRERRADTLLGCCSPIATSEPKSPLGGWESIRSTTPWCSRPASMSGWTALFRVFNNTRYTHIDPAQQQDELTSLVEPAEGEPFVLHPGEFVLGSTLEPARCQMIWRAGWKGNRRWAGWAC